MKGYIHLWRSIIKGWTRIYMILYTDKLEMITHPDDPGLSTCNNIDLRDIEIVNKNSKVEFVIKTNKNVTFTLRTNKEEEKYEWIKQITINKMTCQNKVFKKNNDASELSLDLSITKEKETVVVESQNILCENEIDKIFLDLDELNYQALTETLMFQELISNVVHSSVLKESDVNMAKQKALSASYMYQLLGFKTKKVINSIFSVFLQSKFTDDLSDMDHRVQYSSPINPFPYDLWRKEDLQDGNLKLLINIGKSFLEISKRVCSNRSFTPLLLMIRYLEDLIPEICLYDRYVEKNLTHDIYIFVISNMEDSQFIKKFKNENFLNIRHICFFGKILRFFIEFLNIIIKSKIQLDIEKYDILIDNLFEMYIYDDLEVLGKEFLKLSKSSFPSILKFLKVIEPNNGRIKRMEQNPEGSDDLYGHMIINKDIIDLIKKLENLKSF